jgi:predicted ester cyclase
MHEEPSFELIDEALDAFNSHDIDRFMNFYAKNALYFQSKFSDPKKGIEAIKKGFIQKSFSPFPDIHIDTTHIFFRGELLCVTGNLKGTHKNHLRMRGYDIPPTNRSIEIPICLVYKIVDSKIQETYEYTDQMSYLQQLGIIKEKRK